MTETNDTNDSKETAERRHQLRKKSFLQGRVFYNGGRSSADCTIRDITALGARLKFQDVISLPHVFELDVPSKSEIFHARTIWTHNNEIGVSFVLPDAPALAPSGGADLVERVARLEREVSALRRQLRELMAQHEP